MTELELQHLRREKWRLDGDPVRTLEEAREFIDSVGMCLKFPARRSPVLPSWVGAVAGTDRLDRRTSAGELKVSEVEELLARLIRDKSVLEGVLGEETLLLSSTVFPYFYALASDRNPRQPLRSRRREKASPLTQHVFRKLEKDGPLTRTQLREMLGGALSDVAVERALHELHKALKIARTAPDDEHGDAWDVYWRWAPQPVEEGVRLSDAEAISALASKYLDCVVAATQEEIEGFFSPIAPRARVSEVIRALLAAREFAYTPSETRTLITVAHSGSSAEAVRPRREPAVPRRRNG